MKRIMVDMSATIIHHGHIRIIKAAKAYGDVIIGLTTDEQIILNKGYEPELNYSNRMEILEALTYVSEIIPSPWLIEESFLIQHRIDLLVHGSDNINPVPNERLIILPRTLDISSTILRGRVLKAASDIFLSK